MAASSAEDGGPSASTPSAAAAPSASACIGKYERNEGGRVLQFTLEPSAAASTRQYRLEAIYSDRFYQPDGVFDEGSAHRIRRRSTNGGASLSDVFAFDTRFGRHALTSDGDEDAIIEVNVKTGGAAYDAAIDALLTGGDAAVDLAGRYAGVASYRWHWVRPDGGTVYLLFVDEGGIGFGVRKAAFGSNRAALAYARSRWCCWVLYRARSDGSNPIELASGGIGTVHSRVRATALRSFDGQVVLEELPQSELNLDAPPSSMPPPPTGRGRTDPGFARTWELACGAVPSAAAHDFGAAAGMGTGTLATLRRKADDVSDEAMRHPLRQAVVHLEAILNDFWGEPPSAPPTLRTALARALTLQSDAASAEALVGVTIRVFAEEDGRGPEDADTLIDRLSAALMAEAPTDGEMARLRRLQEAFHMDAYGYACACCFTAALFARTELCIRARSRLTSRLLAMGRPRLLAVQAACRPLVEGALPELLHALASCKKRVVDRLRHEMELQKAAVATSKGLSAGLSVVGSVLVFTPAAPVGIGMLASGGFLGATATGGDYFGTHWQKEEILRELEILTDLERKVVHALASLLDSHLGDVPQAEWEAARSAGVDVGRLRDLEVDTALAYLTAGMHASSIFTAGTTGTTILSVGVTVLSKTLGVVGAAVSVLDFAHACVNDNPNTASLEKLTAFLEARAQEYHVWLVLLEQFMQLATPDGDDDDDECARGGGEQRVAAAAASDATGGDLSRQVSEAAMASPRHEEFTHGVRSGLVHALAASPLERLPSRQASVSSSASVASSTTPSTTPRATKKSLRIT